MNINLSLQEFVKNLSDSDKKELLKELTTNDSDIHEKETPCEIVLFHDKGYKIIYNTKVRTITLATTDYDVDELQLTFKEILGMFEKITENPYSTCGT